MLPVLMVVRIYGTVGRESCIDDLCLFRRTRDGPDSKSRQRIGMEGGDHFSHAPVYSASHSLLSHPHAEAHTLDRQLIVRPAQPC